jgi:hypothetical protein
MDIAISKNSIPIRLTDERWMHISIGHPEIADYYYEILEAIESPDKIFEGRNGEMIAVGIKIGKKHEKRRLIWEQQK